MATTRRNRRAPSPRKTPSGKKHRLCITKRDMQVLRILERYRYLPINFIYELLPQGGNYKKFQERLTDLTGHGYVSRPGQQWESYMAYSKKIVYMLGTQGKRFLETEGLSHGVTIGKGNSYHHELLTCLIIASLEIACTDLRFIHWPELLTFNKVPEATKTSSKPFNIPLIGLGQQTLVPDGTPFCIKGKRTLCFPGIEMDMGTENLVGAQRATIQRKFEGYLNIARHQTYKSHFGFPNLVVPFVTTSERRMLHMMELLDKVTSGNGCTFICFTHMPHLRSTADSPEPVDLLAGQWERVGYPPLSLGAELSK